MKTITAAWTTVILMGMLGLLSSAQAAQGVRAIPTTSPTRAAQSAAIAPLIHPASPIRRARYIEVWNPPEARVHASSPRPLQQRAVKVTHAVAHVAHVAHTDHPDHPDRPTHIPSRAASTVTRSSHTLPHAAAALTASSSRHRAALAWPPAIPRQPGPDGRVLQV